MSDCHNLVRNAVYREWDPIGVGDFSGETGEYESYVPGLFDLLQKQSDENSVFDYLWTVETESIGLCGNREATKNFAATLCQLRRSEAHQVISSVSGRRLS